MKTNNRTITAILALLLMATSCQKEKIVPTTLQTLKVASMTNETDKNPTKDHQSTNQTEIGAQSIEVWVDQIEEVEANIINILRANYQNGDIMEEFYELEESVQVAMVKILLKDDGYDLVSLQHEDLELLIPTVLEDFEVNFEYFNSDLGLVPEYVERCREMIVRGFGEPYITHEAMDNIILLDKTFLLKRAIANSKAQLYLLTPGQSIDIESTSMPFYFTVFAELEEGI